MTQTVQIVPKVFELLRSDARHRIIEGGRGKGASHSIARILLMEGMQKRLFIPCVREVQNTIKYSVKKLLDDIIAEYGWHWHYKTTLSEINGANGTKFVFFGMQDHTADNVKSLEGADRCWVAEAQTFSRRSINVLRPTIRKEGSIIWWDYNPRYETDPVYVDYHLNEDPNAHVLHLTWRDNPWFNDTLKKEMESDYRRNEEEARHIWEGVVRTTGDLFVCPTQLVDVARARNITEIDPDDTEAIGADIAHQGGDRIVFYRRKGFKTVDDYESRYQSTTVTARALAAFTGGRKDLTINIDNGDIGKAVADILEEDLFTNINRINFGGKPSDVEHYDDCVTEMYFDLRRVLEVADIPDDPELRAQLTQRKFMYVSGRRGYEVMRVEPKADFMEHATIAYASPDKADALILCYYEGGAARSVWGVM